MAVRLNSPGGDVFQGLAIFNVLRSLPDVHVKIEGMAASIASIIAMAGKKISISDNGFLMIHNPMGVAMGESEDMRATADALDKVKGAPGGDLPKAFRPA